MAFEGEPRVIPIKGISRAGADSLCEDGAMNEVIGLEYKDGSYVPYSGNVLDKGVPNWAKGIYIHKTSTDTNIIVRTDSGLLWMKEELFNTTEDIGDEGKWIALYEGEVKDVEFIKNIICISTPEKLLYMLFQNGEYKDWTVYKEELPRISFRVDLGLSGKKKTTFYGEEDIVGIVCLEKGTQYSTDTAYSLMIKSLGLAREEGGLTGFFIVSAAYKLKTGEYIKASNPVVMCSPMFKCRDGYYNIERNDGFFPFETGGVAGLTPTIENDDAVVYCNNFGDVVNNKAYITKYRGSMGFDDPLNTLIVNEFDVTTGETTTILESTSVSYPVMSCSAKVISDAYVSYNSPIPTNKLQYKINKDIVVDDSKIDSLCVFISNEIYNYRGDELKNEKKYHFSSVDSYKMINAKQKPIDEIYEEIKNINNLYLVHEIDYADIKKSNEWVDVDLKGKLGDALATQETLPISAFNNTIIRDATLDTYNSRLHIYNYEEEERCAYDIEDFNFYGGYGQYSEGEEKEYESACIVVDYKNENGSSRLVKYFEKPILTTKSLVPILNPCIAYHRGDATCITLYYREYGYVEYSVNKYELSKSKYGGYALYLNKDLTPIKTNTLYDSHTSYLPEQINVSTQKESMRVSDTFLPQTFQYANTYTIGNGRIIGIATLSISLSQDTFGQYPLLVFCTDGIYSMNVDTTGNGVYTNVPPPFSREVCINRNTICEIDGAVLFASNKGLMIATSQGVQEFVPNLNGIPKHQPDGMEIHGLGLELYGEVITNPQVTTLSDHIDMSDFREYVSDPNTYVTYASEKNKVMIYNGNKPYVYWIDIPTRNVTKLPVSIRMDNNDYPTELYVTDNNHFMELKQLSANVNTQTMFQTRPIKLDGGMKTAMRVIVRGYFNSNEADKWAVLLVLGSYDGINWQPLGLKQKPLNGGFNDLGCVLDRVSHKYMMVIFSASLNRDSHIDGIELTKTNKYNNKLK